MDRATLYPTLAVLGTLVPYACFAAHLLDEGVGISFLLAAVNNGVAAGFTADVVISSLVFWVWLRADARERDAGPIWPYVLLNLIVGLSCALPVWLWRRESLGS